MLETLYLIFVVALLLFVALNVYFFIVILALYLELKEADPAKDDHDVAIVMEEGLQLLETPKLETADETDKTDEEKKKEEEAKEETAKTSKIRCPELPKCPSIRCPSWGNCVGPDNFE